MIWAVLYVAGAIVSFVLIGRMDRAYCIRTFPTQPYPQGIDFLPIIMATMWWPTGLPISWLMTRDWRRGGLPGWLVRLCGGRYEP